MIYPNKNINAKEAFQILEQGLPLSNVNIEDKLIFELDKIWDKELVIENCVIESFSGSVTQYGKPVKIKNSHFKNCQFVFSFFLEGLTIIDCHFDSYLDFQAGGHNKSGFPVILTNNIFKNFVNFFDCWYTSDIIVTDNNFIKGTNIKSINQYITFDVAPIIKNNLGEINIESELSK